MRAIHIFPQAAGVFHRIDNHGMLLITLMATGARASDREYIVCKVLKRLYWVKKTLHRKAYPAAYVFFVGPLLFYEHYAATPGTATSHPALKQQQLANPCDQHTTHTTQPWRRKAPDALPSIKPSPANPTPPS